MNRFAFMRRSCVLGVLAAGLSLLGCGPQSATPMPEPPALDGSRIAPSDGAVVLLSEPRPVVVLGAPGAVTPGAVVRALDLDGIEPGVEVPSLGDGSFQLTIPASLGDELRFEARAGGARSAPFDVVFRQVNFRDAFEPSPRHDCLELEPGLQLRLSSAGEARLAVTNTCDGAVSLTTPRFRLMAPPGGELALRPALPLTIEAGDSGTLVLTSASAEAVPADQVLFVDVAVGGQVIRYPFGIHPPE